MKPLKWWMRIVGTFYVVLFVVGSIVKLPVKMTLEQAGIAYDPGNFTHMFLADTWVMFTLEVAVIGVMLWVASRNPLENRILVYTLFGIELVRGIVDDIYMLTRPYEPGFYIGWIVLHSVIIISGWWALQRAKNEPRQPSGAQQPATA